MISIVNNPFKYQHIAGQISREEQFTIEHDGETYHEVTHLILGNCLLKSINAEFFSHNVFKCITVLNLSFNKLTEIPIFAPLPSLRLADFSFNKIKAVDNLSLLPNIEILRLNNNQITSLSFFQNYQNDNLQELWLNNNKIESWLEYSYLGVCTGLKGLMKYNNPSNERAKLDDFLFEYISSLRILDDVRKTENSNGNVVVDVKIMITQAKAFLVQFKQNNNTNNNEIGIPNKLQRSLSSSSITSTTSIPSQNNSPKHKNHKKIENNFLKSIVEKTNDTSDNVQDKYSNNSSDELNSEDSSVANNLKNGIASNAKTNKSRKNKSGDVSKKAKLKKLEQVDADSSVGTSPPPKLLRSETVSENINIENINLQLSELLINLQQKKEAIENNEKATKKK